MNIKNINIANPISRQVLLLELVLEKVLDLELELVQVLELKWVMILELIQKM